MDIVAEIKELKTKKDAAQQLLTKYTTQLETVVEEKAALINELAEKYGVTPEVAQEKLDKMGAKRDELLAAAKEIFDKIPTKSV